MTEFSFDVKLFAIINVQAQTEAQARQLLKDELSSFSLEGVTLSLGLQEGEAICLSDAHIDGEPILVEVAGQDPNDPLYEEE